VLARHPSHGEALAITDGDDGLLDLGLLGEHPLPSRLADVVDVDVD
jgi:hypothetical protein